METPKKVVLIGDKDHLIVAPSTPDTVASTPSPQRNRNLYHHSSPISPQTNARRQLGGHRGARLWTALKHFLPIAAGLPRRQQKHVVGLLRILLLLVVAAVVVGVLLLELINFQRIVFTSNNNGANSQ